MTYRNAEARLPETFLTKTDADAKATRGFWRGVFIGAAALAAMASLVGAMT
jgi:hypothetical protein